MDIQARVTQGKLTKWYERVKDARPLLECIQRQCSEQNAEVRWSAGSSATRARVELEALLVSINEAAAGGSVGTRGTAGKQREGQ